MDGTPVSHEINEQLRKASVLSEDEIALQIGDRFIAHNVVTGKRRRIDESLLQERRVLQG